MLDAIDTAAVQNALSMFAWLAFELSILFLAISFAVGVVQTRIPPERVRAILGSGRGGYFAAALLASVTPFCSCSTIPMLGGLLKARAGFGPVMSFLFVSPLLNPIIVGLLWMTFGWQVTVVYVAMTLTVALAAAAWLARTGFERYVRADVLGSAPAAACCSAPPADRAPPAASCCSPKLAPANSCCTSSTATASVAMAGGGRIPVAQAKLPTPGPKASTTASVPWGRVWRETLDQFRKVAPYLLLGVTLGAVMYGFVPTELIERYAGADTPWAIPVAAIIGIPLYLRAEALIPLAAALAAKGMSNGALIALIIGGAGASLTEVLLLRALFRLPLIAAFVGVVIATAIAAGYVLQWTGA